MNEIAIWIMLWQSTATRTICSQGREFTYTEMVDNYSVRGSSNEITEWRDLLYQRGRTFGKVKVYKATPLDERP